MSNNPRNQNLASSMQAQDIPGEFAKQFGGCKVNVNTYTQNDAKQACGYIAFTYNDIKTQTQTQTRGQVFYLATFEGTSEGVEVPVHRLLFGTCHHVVRGFYVPDGERQKFDTANCEVRIEFPGIGASFSGDDLEVFTNRYLPAGDPPLVPPAEDFAIIVVEKPQTWPSIRPIMPDLNNIITGSVGRDKHIFFAYHHQGSKMQLKTTEFESDSIVDETSGIITLYEHTVLGDSGGMMYVYTTDRDKLVPLCVIARDSARIADEHQMFNLQNNVGAVRTLWSKVRQELMKRDELIRQAHRQKLCFW